MQINCLFVAAATETSTFFGNFFSSNSTILLPLGKLGFRTVEPQTVVALLAPTGALYVMMRYHSSQKTRQLRSAKKSNANFRSFGGLFGPTFFSWLFGHA